MRVVIEGKAEDIRKVLGAKVDETDVKVTYEDDEQPTFKVGDKARLIKADKYTLNGFSDGDIVSIIYDDHNDTLNLHVDNNRFTGWTNAGNLEPIKQLNRRKIVEKAKADVAEITAKAKSSKSNHNGNYTFRRRVTYVKFNVNREKRTVVALVYSVFGDKLLEKGIAKAAPDDVFNAHIGKAIAIRRALGLDVPDEYLHVPQPEGVEAGDVVKYVGSNYDDTPFKVYEVSGAYVHDIPGEGFIPLSGAVVIDDTDRKYDDDAEKELGDVAE